MDQIFNTIIVGGTNVVTSGTGNVVKDIRQSGMDWESLAAVLGQLGLAANDVTALDSAIQEDRDGEDDSVPGPAVASWLEKLQSGSMVVGGSAAGSAIIELV